MVKFLDVTTGALPHIVDEINENQIEPILKFILEVWANNDALTYRNILAWLHNAFVTRNTTVLVLHSDKSRCGKKFLLNWMKKYIFGTDFTMTYDAENLFSRKKMIVINRDTVIYPAMIDKITFAASSDMVDEQKNRSNFVITTHNRNIFDSSHNKDFFNGQHNDHFMCLQVSDKYANDKKYFDDLWEQIANYATADNFYTFIITYEPPDEQPSDKQDDEHDK